MAANIKGKGKIWEDVLWPLSPLTLSRDCPSSASETCAEGVIRGSFQKDNPKPVVFFKPTLSGDHCCHLQPWVQLKCTSLPSKLTCAAKEHQGELQLSNLISQEVKTKPQIRNLLPFWSIFERIKNFNNCGGKKPSSARTPLALCAVPGQLHLPAVSFGRFRKGALHYLKRH